ncbi:MAG: hypothetical protein R2723_07890 [Microbacterium sp.]
MTPATLTIDPEDVRDSARDTSARPAWLEKVAEYVQRAASEGETVTLTAKQRMLTPEQVASLTGVSRSTISPQDQGGRDSRRQGRQPQPHPLRRIPAVVGSGDGRRD